MNPTQGFILACLLLVASALPAPPMWETLHDDVENIDPAAFEDLTQQSEQGVRMARATCDLLSVATMWVTLNHAACAGHCLALRRGFKGGRCRDGVCHCRR